jgi:hypothetical protein
MAYCVDCGRYFDALGQWQRVCRPCYAQRKRAEEDDLRWELDQLRRENVRLRSGAVNQPVTDGNLLPQLNLLAHPDEYQGSAFSTTVRQRLLALRDARR